jgi:hypothetical protein
MRRLLQLAAALLLTATLAPGSAATGPAAPQGKPAKNQKPQPENVEWIWQYTPDDTTRTAARTTSPRTSASFRSFSSSSPRRKPSGAFPINGRYRSLASTALDHLTVPGKVLADENRYISISGCVVHFCPARGLLWIDLNGAHHLVVFAAIDWIKQGRPPATPPPNTPSTSSPTSRSPSRPAPAPDFIRPPRS